MPKYVCSELETNWVNQTNCKTWVMVDDSSINNSWLDALAITKSDADLISLQIVLIWVTAYGYRLVINIIQRRRF